LGEAEAVDSMSHIKHAAIGSLVASLLGAAVGFLLWGKQLDYSGPNRGTMHLVGWMGLGLVSVSLALACLSIAFLQYMAVRERAAASARARRSQRKLAATDA
jgi:hypothetical protein